MKKIGMIILLTSFITGRLWSQDVLAQAFLENFRRGNDETKISILRDSAAYRADEMGELYLTALDYALNNSDKFDLNPDFRRIAVLAARYIAVSGNSDAAALLWELFRVDSDTGLRIAMLNALNTVPPEAYAVGRRLNEWVSTQNNVFRAGGGVNTQVLSEALRTLGTFGQPSSFAIILSSSVLGISAAVTEVAKNSLLEIEGNTRDIIINVIRTAGAEEKLVALQTASSRQDLSDTDLAEIAQEALSVGVGLTSSDSRLQTYNREMRNLAIRILTDKRWGTATTLVIEHFDQTVTDFARGAVVRPTILDAINALGSMGTIEAARRLAVYLDVTNTFVENGEGYDLQIVLTVILNLQRLGSKETLQPLLYVRYLDYSKTVKDAAQQAVLEIRSR